MNQIPRAEWDRHRARASFVKVGQGAWHSAVPTAFTLTVFCFWAPGLGLAPSLAAKDKAAATYTISIPPQPDFSQFDWMNGEWSGKTTDHDPPGDVHLSVGYDLNKRVVIFRETISLPATKTIPAVNESWMGVLSGGRVDSGFSLRIYSSTGFITQYRINVEGAEIRFTPDGGEQPPAGWLFRRVLARTDIDDLTETVSAAPPQKSFFVYYNAKLTRAKPAASKPQ